jgi:hypothetical protein
MVRELNREPHVNGQLALAVAVQVPNIPVDILLSNDKKAMWWERCQEPFSIFAWYVSQNAPGLYAP